MKVNSIEQSISGMQELMKQHPDVLSAYVFGSTVMGFDHQGSDVDIAVRVDKRLTAERIFDLRLQLIGELEDLLDRSVDVVMINTASLKLIHQVMKTGRMICTTDPDKETAFRIQKQKEYFDFQYYIEDDRKALRAFFSG